MEIGNYAEVKAGLNNPNGDKCDMSGWSGIIAEIDSTKKNNPLIYIDWDVETLEKLPIGFIIHALDEGKVFYNWKNVHFAAF